MIDYGLPEFLVRLIVNKEPTDFRCFANNFSHAEKQAIDAYPDGSIYAIHAMPKPDRSDG